MFCIPCKLEWDGRVALKCPKCQGKGEKGKGGPEYKIIQLASKSDGTVFFDIRERTKSALDEVDDEEFIGNVSLHDLEDHDVQEEQKDVQQEVKGKQDVAQGNLEKVVGKMESTLSKMAAMLDKMAVQKVAKPAGTTVPTTTSVPTPVPGPVPGPPVPSSVTPTTTTTTSVHLSATPTPGIHTGEEPHVPVTGAGYMYPPSQYTNFPPPGHLYPGRQFPAPQSSFFPGGYGVSPRYGVNPRLQHTAMGGYNHPPGQSSFPGQGYHEMGQQQAPGSQHPLHQQYQQFQQQSQFNAYQHPPQQFQSDMGTHGGCCGRQETALSKFDYRRYLPASERRKNLVINNIEELWDFHNNLLRDMLRWGDDVTGFVEHMNYMSEMAKSGIYNAQALVAYDAVMLDRAHNWGPEAFQGADTHLSNTKLGMGGTKGVASGKKSGGGSVGKNTHGPGKGGGSGGGRGPGGPKSLVGWRKVASDKGICFRFTQNMVCEGCAFKHLCVNCEVSTHSMFDCPNKGQYTGDNKSA